MGMYAVDTADPSDLAKLSTAASDGRAAATARRRQLSQGMQALNGAVGAPADENLQANGAGTLPAPENLHANGGAASNGHGASNGAQAGPEATAIPSDGAAAATFGRNVSMERRRQLSQGKQALNGNGNGAGAPPAPENLKTYDTEAPASASNGAQAVPEAPAVPSDGLAAAHFGRAVSMQRRRQLSQGKQALNGAGGAPVGRSERGASTSTQAAPGAPAISSEGVAAGTFGRNVSMLRRRQLSQGKQALTTLGDRPVAAPAPAPAAHAPRPAEERQDVDIAGTGREQARARRAQASRLGSAATSRPQQAGQVAYPPKVVVSPTHRDQHVTGLRIGPGVRVTGDEPGSALPVTGTQYVPADGSAPRPGVGPKVGRARTPKGLVVSGTMVRGTVPITGDEAGEHLRITGEADQKFRDDLTPRSDGAFRAAQFPRRADPQGATAVGTRLGADADRIAPVSGVGPWYPLENTDKGLPVTGTPVGRSGRVTGNEPGACRPITGDQYQNLYSSECGGIGGGTAPAAHMNRSRLDPATGGKVTVAQTWGGQFVTGPSVEHRPNVTGDEPGSCRPVTGTPYQGPSTAYGWCEPDEREPATRRLESRRRGVAVTGDLPMNVGNVTGTERGYRNDITGSSYYGEMRPAEPAVEEEERWQGFSVPVALAQRLAGRVSGDAAKEAEDRPPASCQPGGITGSFAVGDGMVTGNNEFLFRPRMNRGAKTPAAVTGEGETTGRTITGSPAAWTPNDKVTGTEGYIAAGRNPSEGGGGSQGWAGARKFKNLATPGFPGEGAKVTGRVGGSPKDAARVTVSGGAQG